jgi:hypothetical protein
MLRVAFALVSTTSIGPFNESTTENVASTESYRAEEEEEFEVHELDPPKIPEMKPETLTSPPPSFDARRRRCHRMGCDDKDHAAFRAAASSSFSRHGQIVPHSLRVRRG